MQCLRASLIALENRLDTLQQEKEVGTANPSIEIEYFFFLFAMYISLNSASNLML